MIRSHVACTRVVRIPVWSHNVFHNIFGKNNDLNDANVRARSIPHWT